MVRSRGIDLSLTMATKINPKTLRGPWAAGFALDVHTTGSTFLGHNAYGHPVFDTGRSPIGELVYRLKYRGDKDALREIVDTVAGFLLGHGSCRPTS
jgi:competence protein ComFC